MRAEPNHRLVKTMLLKRLVAFDIIRTLLSLWPRDILLRRSYSLKSSNSFINSPYGIVTVLAQSFICFIVYCFISKKGGDLVIVYWVSCTRACKALWEVCEYMADWKCALFFSERVIRNHRGPVWRVVTTALSFLYYFSTSNTIHAFFLKICISLSLSLMQGLRTNHTLPMNELIVEQFNSKSPSPSTDG